MAQIHDAGAVGIRLMNQDVLFLYRIEFIGQNSEYRALTRGPRTDEFKQFLICLLEVIDIHQIVLHQLGPQQSIGSH